MSDRQLDGAWTRAKIAVAKLYEQMFGSKKKPYEWDESKYPLIKKKWDPTATTERHLVAVIPKEHAQYPATEKECVIFGDTKATFLSHPLFDEPNPNRPEQGQPESNNMNEAKKEEEKATAVTEATEQSAEGTEETVEESKVETGKVYLAKIKSREPMTVGEYNDKRGWEQPAAQKREIEGYLVTYENDYITWIQKDTFDTMFEEVIQQDLPESDIEQK